MTASKSAPQQLALPASRTNNQVSIATLRNHLTTLTFHSPYLSDAEKLRANHRIHNCEQLAQLELWLHTVPAELAWREACYHSMHEPCSADGGQCLSLNTRPIHS